MFDYVEETDSVEGGILEWQSERGALNKCCTIYRPVNWRNVGVKPNVLMYAFRVGYRREPSR